MHVLVTGGAGYVGANVVAALLQAGHRVSVVDDLSSGHRQALPDEVGLHVGSCGDHAILDRLTPIPDGVMHMAAKCSVGESMQDPAAYYRANLRDSLDLLDWMRERRVGWVIHSSTCAVYGEPESLPLSEQAPTRPINPYGASKLAVDEAIRYYQGAYGVRGTSLRYFNAAGAGADGDLGEDKQPASNLIPRVMAVALGRAAKIDVFGGDFDTADGTGVRDYVHVSDLAAAHLAALQALANGDTGDIYNLGTEEGATVLQVIEEARRVTGEHIPVAMAPPRPGDPPALVASCERALQRLHWRARHSDLRSILTDAWRWHRSHPDGYGDGPGGPESAP